MMLTSTIQHEDGTTITVVTRFKDGYATCYVTRMGDEEVYLFETDDKNIVERYHMEIVENLQ